MALLPSFHHEGPVPDKFGAYGGGDSWSMPDRSNPRAYTLRATQIPAAIGGGECPVLTLADLHFECDVRYNRAVPVPACGTVPCATATTMQDHVVLSVPPEVLAELQNRGVGRIMVSTPAPGSICLYELAGGE